MKHIKLFEEFNPYTGKELAEKMRMFAAASDSISSVTNITQEEKDFTFTIDSKIPSENGKGYKKFQVFIPFSQIDKARVITIENGKTTFSTNIEIKNENDLQVILTNFIEATQIFNDGVVDELVYNASKLNTISEVKKMVKTLTTRDK
jgi:hypothetical protein